MPSEGIHSPSCHYLLFGLNFKINSYVFSNNDDVIWTCLLSMYAFRELQLWYFFHLICLCLSYEKIVFMVTFLTSVRSWKKLEELYSGPCCVRRGLFWCCFCSLFWSFSAPLCCQWPQSVKDHQDIKKQLTLFFSLPSVGIWIPFCKNCLVF